MRLGDPRRPSALAPPTTPFRADAFALALPPGWADATVYTIAGPVADGRSHGVTIVATPHDGRPLAAFADDQVQATTEALFGGAVLLRDAVTLADGSAGERVVVRWSPVPGDVLYQQQVYALVGDRAVAMAATFTARTRRLLGPEVHRIMLGLTAPSAAGATPRGHRSGYSPYRP